MMKVAEEIGEYYNAKHCPPDGVHDYVFEAVGRSVARGCRIAEEVLVLLKAGYGQAAMARWRALHEITVVAEFIRQHGDDCAERYFAQEAVEEYRSLIELSIRASTIGTAVPSDEELQAAKSAFDEAVQRYGKSFGRPYGWACSALQANEANLKAIEKAEGGRDRAPPSLLPARQPLEPREHQGRHIRPRQPTGRSQRCASHRPEPSRTRRARRLHARRSPASHQYGASLPSG